MKKPKACIDGVIHALGVALREHVRNEAGAYIVGESTQDPLCLCFTTGREGQAFKRDHCVAAPIGKPMVAGDYGAHLVAFSMGACYVGNAADWRDDKII